MSLYKLLPIAIVGCLLAAGATGSSAGADQTPSTQTLEAREGGAPPLPSFGEWTGVRSVAVQPGDVRAQGGDGQLANADLRQLVADNESGVFGPSPVALSGDRVRVEVLTALPPDEIRSIVVSLGGEVYGEVPGELVEALMPVDRLTALAATDSVDYVRPPVRVNIPVGPESTPIADVRAQVSTVIGEEVAKTNADAWHDAGFTGAGVKIGIIDQFDGSQWSSAQASGEVPAPSGEKCIFMGSPCDLWTAGVVHGVAVAEIIHEMAPDAQLYVATAYTASDVQTVVDWFHAQGVTIISRSETSPFDGPGDGTGGLDSVVDNAIANGMLWDNAAGNNASPGGETLGSYWRSAWNDPDHNGLLNFADGSEVMPMFCGFLNGLRWNDWGANPTDYDVYIFDAPSSVDPKVTSLDWQTTGAPPLELTNQEEALSCSSANDVDGLVIKLADPGAGTAADVLELMGNGTPFLFSQNPYSAGGPMADSANPGMLAVGAVDPPNGTVIGNYSSWGPTNDGRMKPDLSAASGVSSYTYADGFSGTSAATPAVSGAAALVLSADLANGPVELANYLRDSVVDRGDGGPDSIYGAGELVLGTPPNGSTPEPTPEPTPNNWAATAFHWFSNPVPFPGVSQCDQSKPVPPAIPGDAGLCVKFQLTIPNGNYSFGQTLLVNGSPVVQGSQTQNLHNGNDWELSFAIPATPGTYHLALTADGHLLGESTVEVGAGARVWGDNNCSGSLDNMDSLMSLQSGAGVDPSPSGGCPVVGDHVNVDGHDRVWGDIDCSGAVGPVDSLKSLKANAGQSVNVPNGCPPIKSTVVVGT